MSKNKNKHSKEHMNEEKKPIDEVEISSDEATPETEDSLGTDKENDGEALSEVDKLTKELEELKDAHLRLRAEYDNYRKRTMKEKSDLIKYGGEKIVSGFLDIMDDIELAIKNMSTSENIEGMLEGVELIQNKFISTLKAQGVQSMDVIGKDFDADQHEAVALVPTDEADKKGKILDCVQTGYTLNDKVIRHPKVVVGN